MYNHGIRVTEAVTASTTSVDSSNVHVIVGTAPINMATDINSVINKPVLVSTFEEAKAALGYSEDFKNYTLSEAMYAYFKLIGVGPIVCINVLDPETHKKSYSTSEPVQVVNKQAKILEKGILLDSIVVTDGSTTLTSDTDYLTSFDSEGYVIISILKASVTSITVTANQIDPTAVTDSDIIGGYDVATGAETGLELVRTVYPKFGKVVSLLSVPGYSSDSTVAAIMQTKTTEINSMFSCQCLIDIDTKTTKIYSNVAAKKEADGINSPNAIALWPKVKSGNHILNYSSVYGAVVAMADIKNDDVPSESVSNLIINNIIGIVLDDGTEVDLDINQANALNSNGIVTVLNLNGFRTWGNNTAAYPGVTDPKDRWINNRRFFSWMENRFITEYFERVDTATNIRSIETLVDKENQFCNSLVSAGKCAGAYVEFLQSDNPTEKLAEGKIVVRQHLANYTPAEDILNIVSFDTSLLKSALGGVFNG